MIEATYGHLDPRHLEVAGDVLSYACLTGVGPLIVHIHQVAHGLLPGVGNTKAAAIRS